MQIVFITHHNILNAQAFSPALSWAVVIGGVYGAIRMGLDLLGVALKMHPPDLSGDSGNRTEQ